MSEERRKYEVTIKATIETADEFHPEPGVFSIEFSNHHDYEILSEEVDVEEVRDW